MSTPAAAPETPMFLRICTQLTRLEGRLDADTLYLWRKAVADRDVYSPPAKGCLLEFVRQAWRSPHICCYYYEHHECWRFTDGGHGPTVNLSVGNWRSTEPEALVAALEAAPS